MVVFDDQGAPTCQIAIRAEGPDKAWTDKRGDNKDAKRGLCEMLSRTVSDQLAAPPK